MRRVARPLILALWLRGNSETEPLAAYLARALGRRVRVTVAEEYGQCVDSLRDGSVDAALFGEVVDGGIERLAVPIGSDGHVATYWSAIFTRIDCKVRHLRDVRGMVLGMVDEQSASGYRVPRSMLREAGLDPDRDVRVRLVGRHQLVVEAVLDGSLDVGATHADALHPPSLDRGPDYARLRVLAMSRAIPSAPLVVRASLPPRTRRALVGALLNANASDQEAARVLNAVGGESFTAATHHAPPTLKSIAQLAGVSYATVSRAINGAGAVSPETARRVQAIVDEIGYRPNGHALTLHGRAAPLVGLVLRAGTLAPVEQDLLVDVARRQLAMAGVPLVLCPVDGRLSASPYLELLMDGRFGALVVRAEHAVEAEVVRVARTGRTLIAVDYSAADPSLITTSWSGLVAAVVRCVGSPELPQQHR
jgi:phosphate/phosphite/phosphonate ABC transporter binding protein